MKIAVTLLAFFAMPLSISAQNLIPLSLETIGSDQRLVVYVGISGGSAKPYLFDTGSPGFNAAYYSGPGANGTDWDFGSTISLGSTVTYGSNLEYTLNAVQVSSLHFYAKHDLSTPVATLLAPHGSGGLIIGQVTNATGTGANNFLSNLEQGLAPLDSGLYGTFGASLFTGNNATGSAPYINSSVLGQTTTTGWAVVANDPSADPHVIHGLNAQIRDQFSSSVAWTSLSAHNYPFSNARAATEYGGGEFDFTLSGAGSEPNISWKNGVLLDTGTENNNLNAPNAELDSLRDYYWTTHEGALVKAGNTISMRADPGVGNQEFSFQTTTGDPVVTYNVKVKADATTNNHSTAGISFFLGNSVAFDLENQQTLYTSNVVVVPEPNAFVLLLAPLIYFFLRRIFRRKFANSAGGQ
jgi:hypothetical protein